MSTQKIPLQLFDNHLHLWIIKPQDLTNSDKLKLLLTKNELEKVNHYRHSKSQHTALVTRAFIRSVLSQYATDTVAQDWLFEITASGKPELKNPPLPLRFNLSHNNELIICTVCLEHNIGCDIENLSRKISIESIAKRYFSENEYQVIKNSDESIRNSTFFEYWTLKEAFVKATGLGISQGLDSFSFTIGKKTTSNINNNISIQFKENCSEKHPQEWFNYLIYPDNKHCIGLSVQNKNKTNNNFVIRLFDNTKSLALFDLETIKS